MEDRIYSADHKHSTSLFGLSHSEDLQEGDKNNNDGCKLLLGQNIILQEAQTSFSQNCSYGGGKPVQGTQVTRTGNF